MTFSGGFICLFFLVGCVWVFVGRGCGGGVCTAESRRLGVRVSNMVLKGKWLWQFANQENHLWRRLKMCCVRYMGHNRRIRFGMDVGW